MLYFQSHVTDVSIISAHHSKSGDLQVIKGYMLFTIIQSLVTYKSSRVTCCSTSFKVSWLTSHQGLHAVQHHSKSRDVQVIKGYMLFNFFNEGLSDLNFYHLYSDYVIKVVKLVSGSVVGQWLWAVQSK